MIVLRGASIIAICISVRILFIVGGVLREANRWIDLASAESQKRINEGQADCLAPYRDVHNCYYKILLSRFFFITPEPPTWRKKENV